jgi:hypothetical protein
MQKNTKIYWARSESGGKKDRVPMYLKKRLTRSTDEGQRGDAQLGRTADGEHDITVLSDDCELEDETPAF